jgi:hypothetical protein
VGFNIGRLRPISISQPWGMASAYIEITSNYRWDFANVSINVGLHVVERLGDDFFAISHQPNES